MHAKLTLRLSSTLIKKMKIYAKKRDKSVSQLVSDYIAILDLPNEKKQQELPPITRFLKGVLHNTHLSEKDYKHYLEDKYL